MLVPARLYIDVMQSLLLAGVFRLALQSQLPVHRARHLVRSKSWICQVKLSRIFEQGLILFDVGNGSREGQDDVAYENIGARRAKIGEDGAQAGDSVSCLIISKLCSKGTRATAKPF